MYSYKTGLPAKEHDDFVKASNQTNLLQSSSWAQIKDNWGNERIGFYKDDVLVASASILIKPLPLGFTMLYIPRGPIMDYTDKELVAFVLASLKAYGKTKKALFIKCDPMLLLRQAKLSEFDSAKDEEETLEAIKNLETAGASWTGRTQDLAETIQPRFQANLYAESYDVSNFAKKTRQSLRTARNKGVEVQFGGNELLPDFAELMKKTEVRKGIHLRGLDYYQKLLATYPEDSYVTMATLNLTKRLETLQEQLDKTLSEREKIH